MSIGPADVQGGESSGFIVEKVSFRLRDAEPREVVLMLSGNAAATVLVVGFAFAASADLASSADEPIPPPAVMLPPVPEVPPVVQAPEVAEREDSRIDEKGFPKWPLFDERAVEETLKAIRSELKAHADAIGVADDAAPVKAKLKRKPKSPPPEPKPDPLFEFEPEYTEGAFANLPEAAYAGAVVGPDRKIYFIPFNAATVLVYDPQTGHTQTINLPNGHHPGKYMGGVLAPNGCIYCVPAHSADVAVIDTQTQGVRVVATRSGRYKWCGGVAAGDGKIYCAPNLVEAVLTIDTQNKNILGERANNPPFRRGAFAGAAIGGDGAVYFAPFESPQCFRLKPSEQNKIDAFGNAPAIRAYSGAATGPDGRVYCVPHSADHVLVIDPNGLTVAPLQLSGDKPIAIKGERKFCGGVLAPDGNIYCIPHMESRILVINTPKAPGDKASLRYWGEPGEAFRQERYVKAAYHGGVLGPDGRIYFVPYNAKHLLAIGKRKNVSMNRVLSPMFNKF